MRTNIRTMFLTLPLLTSCASPSMHVFEGNFSLYEVARISRALAPAWKLNPRSVHFVRHESLDNVWALACLSCNPCLVQWSGEIPVTHVEAIALHEYGHCVGLSHKQGTGMRRSPEPLTRLERRQLLQQIKEKRRW